MKIGMAVLKLLLNGGLLFGLLTVASASFWTQKNEVEIDSKDYCSANYTVVPIYYNVELLSVMKKNLTFYGETNAIIYTEHSMPEINLHMIESQIEIFDLEIHKREGSKMYSYIVDDYYYNPTSRLLTLSFDKELPAGNYIVYIRYILIDNSYFEYRYTKDGKKPEWMITIPFHPNGIQKLSCLAEQKPKPIFSISVKHYYKYSALSNIPLQSLQPKDTNQMQWSRFKPNMDTVYPITIVLTNFNCNDVSPNIFMWQREHLKEDLKLAQSVVENVEQHLPFKSKWSTIDSEVNYVAMPDIPENCISYWGLVFYREQSVIYNETIDHLQQKMKVARFVARQVIYGWLDNFTNAIYKSKAYMWFNLGVAELLGQIAIDKIFPDSNMMNMYTVQDQFEFLRLTKIYNTFFNNFLQIDDPLTNNLMHSSPNYRITSILRMLRHAISDEVFLNGVDKYFNDPAFKSGTPNDFWFAMQNALNELNSETELDVKEAMSGWLVQKDYQMVMATRDYEKNLINIWVYYDQSNEVTFWIPITFTTRTTLNFTEAALHNVTWLKVKPRNLSFFKLPIAHEEKDWIMVNLLQAGNYRVNYDLENWKRIAKHLNSFDYREIHVLNRAKIIDDAFHLMIDGHLNSSSSVFWEIANYLILERDYIAWYPMIKALEFMSPIFPLPDKRTEIIKEKLNRILEQFLNMIGYEEYANENDNKKTLRKELIKWSCTLGNRRCRIMAAIRLQNYYNNPEAYNLTQGWKDLTLCKGLGILTYITFPIKEWLKDPKLSQQILPCIEDVDLIITYLDRVAKNENGITDVIQIDNRYTQSFQNNFRSIVARHARNDKVLEYILLNFKLIKPKGLHTLIVLTEIINHVYSKEQLDKIHEYVMINEMAQLSIIQLKIDKRLSQIKKQMHFLEVLST